MKKNRTVIEPGQDTIGNTIFSVWEYRELVYILATREVSLRYRQTILGVIWVIIQPLLASAVFTLVFGMLLNAPSDNVNYALFTFVGMLPWGVFSQSLQKSGNSLIREIRLITKIFFPRIIIPTATILATLLDFLVSFILLLGIMAFTSTAFSLSLLTLPFFLAITYMIALGLGVFFAAINVFYRDFTYVLPFIVQVWLYISPIAYSDKLIPQNWKWVYDINPMVGVISGFRWAVFQSTEFPASSVLYSFIVSLVIFFGGIFMFTKFERKFADVV